MKNKTVLLVLIVLNVLVLLGQLVPDMTPPFARTVNIIFLIGSFLFFASALSSLKKGNN
ncbi:hypothetical protein HUK80_03475 [Flavobacterium sp. MAH-1]|uniref:Uncharacterized protein n=1 Tax=Flavobacterium agri TaxID=2743471 RepID=A0A7Y8XZT7_9FLAO|nr:hypothetical protein [Flavobacterium agri]NUY79944.1 hypothetical protein [Flavobacterium agri]NYA69969.1 hypothetical protein [Flavobacterium agri]